MSKTTQQKAVIYCRISNLIQAQSQERYCLKSQEESCREYARLKGYEVVNVFHDEGSSIDLHALTGMNAVLKFVNEQDFETIVIFDRINHLASGGKASIYACNEIRKAGGKPESPNQNIVDDPESILIERIISAAYKFEKEIELKEKQCGLNQS